MSSDLLISVNNLDRQYGSLQAVQDVSFELRRGEVLGFLGPNGAGKSTTMQIITGNLAPSSGQVKICGIDLLDNPRQAKARIGYLPERPPLYRELSVDEYLVFCTQINRIPKPQRQAALQRAKQRCGLEQVGRRLINNLSKGYQQRVGIAQAIIHSPDIVVLDEPTVGLDPIQIREIRHLIRELANEHAVILSTHILPEVQMTCNRVQIINQGRLVFSDDIDSLNRSMRARSLILGLQQPPSQDELETSLKDIDAVESIEVLGDGRWRIQHAEQQNPATRIAEIAVQNNWGLIELSPETRSLEQIFIDITATEQSLPESSEFISKATEGEAA
ncbi:Gliding motility-associated ABC transporter ATP-binding protein GldA [hydrothermal vent metagenome]|uniref:Gliding motility-associated ABC transporter ATP-binding protein GldA n=1 Tax=hydrothermal vent metagenome TaxID=652676 RepID=A0A3B1BPM0_9ZZZZ